MNPLIEELSIALVSILAGTLVPLIDVLIKKINKSKKKDEVKESYSEKVTRLTENLKNATHEVDEVINEIEMSSQSRAKRIHELEKQLKELSFREKQARKRLDRLNNTSIESVRYFEEMLAKENKRSAWRDIILFILGVVITTIISILLSIFGIV